MKIELEIITNKSYITCGSGRVRPKRLHDHLQLPTCRKLETQVHAVCRESGRSGCVNDRAKRVKVHLTHICVF